MLPFPLAQNAEAITLENAKNTKSEVLIAHTQWMNSSKLKP